MCIYKAIVNHLFINFSSGFTSFLIPLEKNDPPPQATTSAFSTVTLSTTSYMNGGTTSSLPSSESPKTNEPLKPNPEPVSQPGSYSCNPSHPLLSIHHTLYEEEEEQGHRDKLVERPGELIAAGEC